MNDFYFIQSVSTVRMVVSLQKCHPHTRVGTRGCQDGVARRLIGLFVGIRWLSDATSNAPNRWTTFCVVIQSHVRSQSAVQWDTPSHAHPAGPTQNKPTDARIPWSRPCSTIRNKKAYFVHSHIRSDNLSTAETVSYTRLTGNKVPTRETLN